MRVRIEPREEGEDDEENRCVDQEGLPSRRCFLFHLHEPRGRKTRIGSKTECDSPHILPRGTEDDPPDRPGPCHTKKRRTPNQLRTPIRAAAPRPSRPSRPRPPQGPAACRRARRRRSPSSASLYLQPSQLTMPVILRVLAPNLKLPANSALSKISYR